MGDDYSKVRGPHHTAGLHIFRVFKGDDDAAYHTRDVGYRIKSDRGDGVDDTVPQDSHNDDREQQSREGEQKVDKARHKRVKQAPVVTGDDAQRYADKGTDDRAREAHKQRDARADDDARQHIAPKIVGT